MRRIILAIVSTTAALVFLLTFKTHSVGSLSAPPAAVGTPSASAGGGSGTSGGTGTSSGASPTPSSAGGSAGGGSTSGSTGGGSTTSTKTVTGAAADTIYGPVQVQITVKNGKLTAAATTVYPTETSRDAQINAYAIPRLEQETVAAGNAKIDAVSGATYTSNGYIASLQSALDKAGI